MKTAVIFGAGQIGRGFLGDICFDAGYTLVFVDVVPQVVNLLNERKSYPIWIMGETKTEKIVSRLTAIPLADTEAVSAALAAADVAFTAVGVANLAGLGPTLAAGIRRRCAAAGVPPLNVVICENILGSSEVLHSAIAAHLPPETRKRLDDSVGLVETVVSRMTAPVPEEVRRREPLLATVESYNILPVARRSFRGPLPEITAFLPVDDLLPYEEMKLFIHNLAHAALAYLGFRRGYTYVWESMRDDRIAAVLDGVLDESRRALLARHPSISPEEMSGYIANLLTRFTNRLLNDTVHRVGRDPIRKLGLRDRIIGAASLCLSRNIFPRHICIVAAAGLCYNYPQDPQAVRLQQMLRDQGVIGVLREVAGLDGGMLVTCIAEAYHGMLNESCDSTQD